MDSSSRRPRGSGSASLGVLEKTAQRVIDSDTAGVPVAPTATAIDQAAGYRWTLDAETTRLVEEGFRSTSDYLHRMANEPSIGLYHCTNHVARAMPRLASMQEELRNTCKEVDNATYDCTDAARAVSAMHELVAFRNTKDRFVCFSACVVVFSISSHIMAQYCSVHRNCRLHSAANSLPTAFYPCRHNPCLCCCCCHSCKYRPWKGF